MRRDTWFRHRGRCSGPELLGENTTESARERLRTAFCAIARTTVHSSRRVHPLVHKRRWDDVGRRLREGLPTHFFVAAVVA